MVSIAGVTGATSAQIGDAIVYEITVTNDGKAAASDVVVTDTVTNLASLAVAEGQGTNPSVGSVDGTVWTIGDMAVDASATLYVTATVADSAISAGAVSGSVKNKVTGSYTFNDDPMPEPTPAEVETPVYKSSLTIAKVVLDADGNPCTETPVVAPGDTVTFRITVTNKGFAADTVTVTDILPNEMTLAAGTDSYTSTGSVTIDDVTYTTYTWNKTVPAATSETDGGGMTTVAPGTTTITVVAQVKTDALPEGTYSKTVENAATMNELTAEAEVEISNGDGGLKIMKSLQGSDLSVTDLAGKISFTVKNSSDAVVGTVSLEDAITGKTLDLDPGEYTVYEDAEEVADYSLVTTVNNGEYNEENGYSVTVEAGKTAQVSFRNVYTAKIYRVIFDAVATGSAAHDITLSGSVQSYDRYTWLTNRWGVVDTTQAEANTLELIFTKDQIDAVDGYNVGVQAAPGYAWNEQFVLDSDENVTYDSFAAIVADLASRATMDTGVEYLDGSGDMVTGDVWTIRVHAEYDYDLTYTFNDFGSEHVSMAYYKMVDGEIEADPVLTSVNAFGNASNPVEVCAQENLDDPSKFEPVIFFVKADDGYQLSGQYWEASSATALTSVTKSSPSGLWVLPPTFEEEPDMPATFVSLMKQVYAAGYTHCFTYEENGTEADDVFKADVLNRYFKVVATENPTYTITGTKTVALGGNRAPGSTTFTFNLEGQYLPQPKANALSLEMGGDVWEIKDTATVTINGSGSATFQFDTIEFTEAGLYFFRVTEVDDSNNSVYWNYDDTEFGVEIVVIREDDGSLKIDSVTTYQAEPADELWDVTEVNAIVFTNVYTRSGGNNPGPGPGDGDGDGDTDIPDENTPTTDLPDENTPTTDLPDENTPTTETPEETTDLPDEETPLADVPETGDSTGVWVLAAGVSGLALVWLALTGKKRRDENA